MTQWLAKLFVVLSLVVSCEALATVESVPPEQKWAVAAGVNALWNISFYQPSKSEACLFFYNNLVIQGGYSPHTYIGDDGTYCRWTNFFDHGGVYAQQGIYWSEYACPVPKVNPDVPYIYRPATNTCEREAQKIYTLALTPKEATIEPGKQFLFTAIVVDQDLKLPSESIPVNIEVKVDPKSGGHDHGDSSRPKGSVSPTSGNNVFGVEFKSTDVSGTHTITAKCDQCVNQTATAVVTVKVDGLIPIPSSAFYALEEPDPDRPSQTKHIGETDKHSENHFLKPNAVQELLEIAMKYHTQQEFQILNYATNKRVPPLPLYVNDASLEWGGKFDLSGTWTGSHAEHKRGASVDLRANDTFGAIPAAAFEDFEVVLRRVLTNNTNIPNYRKFLRECTADPNPETHPKAPQHKRLSKNYCASQLDGTLDSNRHYHLRLKE
ncbi:MAG: hypothetical protein PHQ60_08810 [Sideroxydans sp.]|nr:hypothetical protein [Sideroxydans sp.]